ncbi:glucose-1-phosphate cytidylyltransferase [Crossiella sp. CA-258035]|uniref:glucose-1-phosphate cytidylyltransferase n=1 Tax=Crossiella sp. CA-258035 TaxID=2981138 RepID=UPI0024BD3F45|nr:glucose-1-phosphate cytidylyltransferase [Crossiella sp. CA-258035]WHT21092.1 glucose-1-phosphate cytidylyltransferase [Crossiella sp. CA-258035]
MKVVLFCGGYGMRMRNGSADDLPKPMHPVGPRPLLWHVMRYYAHFGHKDFILCLGYGAQYIKDFFLNYSETASNDFVLRNGKVELLSTDISDWTITFAQTGQNSPIGERLRRVRHLVAGEEMFLANYADVLTDAPLDEMVRRFAGSGASASMMVVPPQSSFHCVDLGDNGKVAGITPVSSLPLWENGGFFVLRQEVFDHIPENGDLVEDGCGELAKQGKLLAYPYRGFWQPADTVKERVALEQGYQNGDRPWMLWEREAEESAPVAKVLRLSGV